MTASLTSFFDETSTPQQRAAWRAHVKAEVDAAVERALAEREGRKAARVAAARRRAVLEDVRAGLSVSEVMERHGVPYAEVLRARRAVAS